MKFKIVATVFAFAAFISFLIGYVLEGGLLAALGVFLAIKYLKIKSNGDYEH